MRAGGELTIRSLLPSGIKPPPIGEGALYAPIVNLEAVERNLPPAAAAAANDVPTLQFVSLVH
jgi:hypothetical protein